MRKFMFTRKTVLTFFTVWILMFVLFSFAFAGQPVLPWKKFNDPDMLAATSFASLGTCPKGEVMFAAFRTPTNIYVMGVEPVSGRIFIAVGPLDPNAKSEYIGFGTVDPKDNNVIPPLRWEKFSHERHNGVCLNLFPEKA